MQAYLEEGIIIFCAKEVMEAESKWTRALVKISEYGS